MLCTELPLRASPAGVLNPAGPLCRAQLKAVGPQPAEGYNRRRCSRSPANDNSMELHGSGSIGKIPNSLKFGYPGVVTPECCGIRLAMGAKADFEADAARAAGTATNSHIEGTPVVDARSFRSVASGCSPDLQDAR